MTTSCQQCGAGIPDGRGTSRCLACRRGLTGARDEHSVLFSLADFAAAGPALPRSAPASQRSRSDEGSGLIDIRAMQAALGGRAEPAPPRFITPTALPVAPPPTASHRAVPSQLPLYGLLAALMFGLASLTAFVLSEPAAAPPPTPRHTIPAPVVLAAPVPEEVEEPEEIDEPVAEPVAVEPVAKVTTSRPRPSQRPTPAVARPQPEVVKPQAASKPASSDEDTMKCLLGQGACKVERPAEAPRPAVAAPVASDLPERLSDTDITAGTGPAKARATSSCARLAKPGERVKIKLSIAGPTGTVIRATAEDDGGNPALAACCAGELAKASFKPVQRPQMGALVTLKF
ncbi:MAG TPA: hypothetical protein VGB85_25445 [Nannocystis sp.]